MKKLTVTLLFILSISSISVFAQTLSDSSETEKSKLDKGAEHEKQVSSTLREISNLKLQLEKRKLQMEIQKLDESKTPATTGAPAANQLPVYSPFSLNNMIANENKSAAKNVKVLMIYGPSEDLMAKISVGTQGGYVVKKGDIMPDGKTVMNVNKNFIEVSENPKNPTDLERVFVFTQYNNTQNNAATNDGGNKSSSNLLPSTLPVNNGQINPNKISNMMTPIPSSK